MLFVLEKEKKDLYKEKVFLDTGQIKKYFFLLKQRASRIPLQHLIKSAYFYDHKFVVTPDVLIPRPETEVLIEKILERSYGRKVFEILDIGTGSGVIAVTLAHYFKEARITGIDVSSEALRIAEKNAAETGFSKQITFLQSDCFEKLKGKSFDIIVSNPPYIPSYEISFLEEEVKHDPVLALDGGADGLVFYKRIISEAKDYFREKGLLAFEIGFNQAKEVCNMLKEEKFFSIKVYKDYSQVERVIIAEL